MSEILLEIESNVALITMNRPETYNAITGEFVKSFIDCLLEVKQNEEVRSVVITGAGKGFCSGADLKIIEENDFTDFEVGRQYMGKVHELTRLIYHFPVPVIAAVNGVCVGGGFGLALACDYIISAESATYSMIFPNVGLVPDLGSMYTLPRKIGLPKAKRLMYTAKMLTAQEAEAYGIVEDVVTDDELLHVCMEEAKTIAHLAPRAIRYAKDTLNATDDMTFEALLVKEAYQQGTLFQTEDFKEAVRAFVEKRSPQFSGK